MSPNLSRHQIDRVSTAWKSHSDPIVLFLIVCHDISWHCQSFPAAEGRLADSPCLPPFDWQEDLLLQSLRILTKLRNDFITSCWQYKMTTYAQLAPYKCKCKKIGWHTNIVPFTALYILAKVQFDSQRGWFLNKFGRACCHRSNQVEKESPLFLSQWACFFLRASVQRESIYISNRC